MSNRKAIYLILVSLLALSIILLLIIFKTRDNALKVIFFDIGQGDSILIEQGIRQVIIDGGPDEKMLLAKVGKYVPFWDRSIDAVLISHPDQDHIGGFASLVKKYEIGNIIGTNADSKSKVYENLQKEISLKRIKKIEAKQDLIIKFTNDAIVKVIYPFESIQNLDDKNSNTGSVVVKLTFGKNNFLFTGDLPTDAEDQVINRNLDINSSVLKVAHHGSRYSSSENFLTAIKPKDAVISVAAKNLYGHPNTETLQRLEKNKINILRTDELGNIIYECKNASSGCQKSFEK